MAREGTIALSGWDLERDGPLALDGEWELYWGQRLTPADLHGPTPPAPTGHLRLPSAWNDHELQGRRLGKAGFATLRLKVSADAPPAPRRLGLRLADINAAFALWVDGEPVAQSGVVGTRADLEVPGPSVLVVPLAEGRGAPRELVLQVSNHTYRSGGVGSSVELGLEADLARARARQLAIAFFYLGGLLVMGAYHLILYWLRRSNRSPLYLGLYCFLWSGYYLFSDSSGWAIRSLVAPISIEAIERVSLGCFFLSLPVGVGFFESVFPAEFSRRVLRAVQATAVVYVGVAATASLTLLSSALPVLYVGSSGLILYTLHRLDRARRRGREGAVPILAGFVVLGSVGLNDMAYDVGLIPTGLLLPVGMFVFILAEAFALSARLNRAFSAVEHLSVQLQDKNRALEKEVEERSFLEKEVVRISEEERRHASDALHDGLCQQLTGARLCCSVMERKVKAGTALAAADVSALGGLLEESVDQAYALSKGLWPLDQDPELSGDALEDLARRFAKAHGVEVEFSMSREPERWPKERLVQLYRIAQEALTNAVRHGRPRRIAVALVGQPSGELTLCVEDDGVGRGAAAKSSGGLGMKIMAHRARVLGGTLQVTDVPGGGTRVTCRVPSTNPEPTPVAEPSSDGGPSRRSC